MTLLNNPILMTDSYKFSHYKQYPEDLTHVSSYIEPRATKAPFEAPFDKVMFFGLQMFLQSDFFRPITEFDVMQAKEVVEAHGEPFALAGFKRIVEKHGGYWPVSIQALPEGTVHGAGIPQVQVENTDPLLPWVTSFIETALLRAVWYPSTVASISYAGKQLLKKYLLETAGNLDGLPFKLHDFGCRGVESNEAAGIGGCAHLVNFMGTDTVMALAYANQYYSEPMAGYSIPAAEHSTIMAWGKHREKDAYENMLKQFSSPGKLVAVVSDTYDIFNAVENIWGEQLKDKIKQYGGTLVVRPDSGDPTTIPVELMKILGNKFGYEINTKGYKMLPPYLRIIQGDGVNLGSIESCLVNIKNAGWSTDNIAFGMGAELLQKVNRDTFSYAMKENAVKFSTWTDKPGWQDRNKEATGKPSKAGRQAVILNYDGNLQAIREDQLVAGHKNLLKLVWEDGKHLSYSTFKEVRARANFSKINA
jgi:nicotinamide phosphoribosyltransferase